MTCVQDEVGLFERQRVSLSRRPLLQHLIAYRPHQDRGVITVAQNQIGQVTLMPLVEETGIVVLRLLTAPHVERLVHHDESHCVTHVQQFGGRRIMRRADGVHTHRLQLRQLTVQGVLIQCSTQTAEVVMLADTIQLEVLAVEPEARLGIKAEIAETGRRLHLIDHLAASNQLGTYGIDVRILTRPLVE